MEKANINEHGDLVCQKCNTNIMTPSDLNIVEGIGQCMVCKTKFSVTAEVATIANSRRDERPVAGIIHINEGIDLDILDSEEQKGVNIDGEIALLGGWRKEDDNNYYADVKYEYSAIYYKEDGYIAVIRSEHTKLCNITSECYTMSDGNRCGNLGEPNNQGVKAFNLPEEWYGQRINKAM